MLAIFANPSTEPTHMELKEIRAELSIKMLELEKALDIGMPYPQLKIIYGEIKELQYKLIFADTSRPITSTESESTEVVIE